MIRSSETSIVMGVLNNNQTINIQNNIGQGGVVGGEFDVLPKSFVQSMKTLFDILDDQQTGYVKFIDIEKGWQDDGSKGLPRGVIESLRKVTPSNGLLTFERFCAGLKLCLLKNQNQLQMQTENNPMKTITNNSSNTTTINGGVWKNKSATKVARPPSAPALDIENPVPTNLWSANIRPHNISTAYRALSMPQLSPDSEGELTTSSNTIRSSYNSPPPPPKPPRASALNANTGNTGILSATNKAEIRHALQNWQIGVMRNEIDLKDKQTNNNLQQCGYRGSADGGSSSATDSGNFTSMPLKKTTTKRREPRRHTLQNGIDYNMLKRLKQYEEEREVLLLGLDSVNKAREWYMQQILNVQEKIKYLGQMGSSNVKQWSEVQQERLNFQRAHVLEVNRNLSALAECWERGGFPFHFNLAIRTPLKTGINCNNVNTTTTISDRLSQQNRLLSNESHLKSERIAILEMEKQALLAELYELKQRSSLTRHTNSYLNVLSQSSPGCSSSSGGLGDADVVY